MEWPVEHGASLAQPWWIYGLMQALSLTGVALLCGLLVAGYLTARRCIAEVRVLWCAWQARVVEVELASEGLPGCRRFTAVSRCSAFESPTTITCDRRCLSEAAYRTSVSLGSIRAG